MDNAPVSIAETREVYYNNDGQIQKRKHLYVKLSVTFRDKLLKLLKGPKLSVFLCIALHCNDDLQAFPSISKICDETGYSNRSVIVAARELQEMGLVEIKNRTGETGHKSNLYTVRGFAHFGEGPPLVNLVHKGCEPSSQPLMNLVHTKKNQYKKSHEEDGPAATSDLDFDTAFPRKYPEAVVEETSDIAQEIQTPEGREAIRERHRRARIAADDPVRDIEAICPTLARYSPPVGVDRAFVLQCIACLRDAHVPLDVKKTGEVRYWIRESESLGRKTAWNLHIVGQAIAKAQADGMTIKSPKSIAYAVADVLQSAHRQAQTGGGGERVQKLTKLQ